MSARVVKYLGTVLALMIFVVKDARAYIDPGSGMLFWQGMIAGIGGVLIFVRRPIKTIRGWLDRILGK